MRLLPFFLSASLALALFFSPAARADDTVPLSSAPASTPPPAAETPPPLSVTSEPPRVVTGPVAELSLRDAVILGLVEGITEFLPISSTGHLIIATQALGLEKNEPLVDAQGQLLWYKKPSVKNPDGEPLTLKLAADTFTVVIQFGAILAVILLYWDQLIGILRGLTGQNASGVRLLRNIILGFIPAAVIGLGIHHWIDVHLFSVRAVIVAQVSGAVLMWAAERWRKQNSGVGLPRLEPSDLSPKQSLGIGAMQCLALWPGTSRSMVTMVGGYFAGLSPAKAAEFSFLVGLPTLAGASALKGYSSGAAMIAVFGWPHVLVGTLVAALSAVIAVKFLVSYLGRHGLGIFAIYRVALGATLFGLLALNFFP